MVLGCPRCDRTNGVPDFVMNWTGTPPQAADGHDHHVAASKRYVDHLHGEHNIQVSDLCRGHLPVEVFSPGSQALWVPVLEAMAQAIDVS